MTTTLVTDASQQVTEVTGAPVLLVNLDRATTIYLDNVRGVSQFSTALPPLGTLAVDGSRPWYAATLTGQSATLQAVPGGTQWSASPAQIAEQIALTGINVTVTGLSAVAPSGDPSGLRDTTAIQAALSNAGNEVLLAAGTYVVNATLTLPSNVTLRGASRGGTLLKLAAGVNAPILASQGFAALTGSGSNTGGVTGFRIQDLALDGNASQQTAPAAAAVQVFGYDFVIDNVSIRNFLATDGLYTEFGLAGTPGPEKAMEARYSMLRIHDNTLTGAGWHNRGPHDSQVFGAFIYNNTTSAFGYWPETTAAADGSACLVNSMHVWGSHSVAFNLTTRTLCVNCVAEGGHAGQVLVTGGDCAWTAGTIFPAGSPGYGVQVGTAATEATGLVLNDPLITGFAGTSAANAALSFVNSASGRYSALVYQAAGRGVFGAAANNEVVKVSYGGLNLPALAPLGALGASPPAEALVDGSDYGGYVEAGTGTGTTAGSAVQVTFAQPKAAVPAVSVFPANAAAAALAPYVSNFSTTGFVIGFANAPAASQPLGYLYVGYQVNY